MLASPVTPRGAAVKLTEIWPLSFNRPDRPRTEGRYGMASARLISPELRAIRERVQVALEQSRALLRGPANHMRQAEAAKKEVAAKAEEAECSGQ